MIAPDDLLELKRLATNTYDGDKKCMHRIIRGIEEYKKAIFALQNENASLKAQLANSAK